MRNKEMEIGSVDSNEAGISRRKFLEIGALVSMAAFSLTTVVEAANNQKIKEGMDFPDNGIVNIYKEDGIVYYNLENASEATLEMLEYSEENVLTSDQSKNITWEYATFQVKDGNLKVEVVKEPQEIVTYKLSIIDGEDEKEVIFNVIPEVLEVVNTAPVLNSVSVSADTLYDHWNNNYSILQNTDYDFTFTANWTDADGDNLQIVINWVEYSWTSETITLNLAHGVIEKFYIKEFDGEAYSNEILVQVSWR